MKSAETRFRVLAFVVMGFWRWPGCMGCIPYPPMEAAGFTARVTTRYRSAKSSVIPGDIIDRPGRGGGHTD